MDDIAALDAIPVTFGRLRSRGTAQGALIDDDADPGASDRLRRILRTEAGLRGIEASPAWLANAMVQLLRLFERTHSDWLSTRQSAELFVFETRCPSGRIIRFGDHWTLDRCRLLQGTSR